MAVASGITGMGYLIWDSRKGLNCTPTVLQPIQFSSNFRPASLVPKSFGCDSDIQWIIYDDYESSNTAWGVYATGQRNGIAVTVCQCDGSMITYLWDVLGYVSSDEFVLNSPHAKMERFAAIQCLDCDENSGTLTGQYAGTNFPSLAGATTYCYSFTRTDAGDAQALSLVELFYANNITTAVLSISHVYATGVSTYRICFNKPVAQIGTATGDASFTLL